MRPALIAGVGLAFLQQFIGTNTIIYYAPKTFTNVGFEDSAAILGTVGIGTVNVLMTLVAIRFIDRIGRKPLLLFGNAGMVISLIVLSFSNLFFGNTSGAAWTTVICLGVFIVVFAVSWGPIVWVMLPEPVPPSCQRDRNRSIDFNAPCRELNCDFEFSGPHGSDGHQLPVSVLCGHWNRGLPVRLL